MRHTVVCIVTFALLDQVINYQYCNETTPPDAVSLQLAEFRWQHAKPIGVLTKVTGEPIDIRDTVTLNSKIFDNRNHFRLTSHVDRERIPERIVHSKAGGAFGYFEVTHDVSKYTKADVFNSIGKKTKVTARFSVSTQNLGGSDLIRDIRAVSLKIYTREGNLDFVTFNIPVFTFKDPIDFTSNVHAFRRNPRTYMYDNIMFWEFLTLKPDALNGISWMMSDQGIPNGYRKTNYFPIHTYEIYNKHGKNYFVRFNFRSEIGLFNLTNAQAMAIAAEDRDYSNRDLYNAIAAKNYPSWKLDMDILEKEDLRKVDFDPFDVTRLWTRGTYHTVPIGRLVLDRRVDNNFKDIEQAAFCPDNLVPGITGPHDSIFRARKLFYPDTQNYRLGVNHDNIEVNAPLYRKTYSRDGMPPVRDNMKDAPNYLPNSFNGPMPYVDEARPKILPIILQSLAVDLQPVAEFYNDIVESDAHRQRIAENYANTMTTLPADVEKNALHLLSLIDVDLGKRVRSVLRVLKMRSPQKRREQLTQCFYN